MKIVSVCYGAVKMVEGTVSVPR